MRARIVGPRVLLPLLAALLLLAAPLLGGCAGRITPPEAPVDPVDIYLLDHGRHASLVLPRSQGGMVRYSYGEWGWYVEGRRHLLAGASAMLWPTTGALGRGVFDERIDSPRDLYRLVPEGVARIYPLQVEAARVTALQRQLDTHFEEGVTPTYSAEFGLEFVPYPRGYWLSHQSNLVTAQWLRRLGAEVGGIAWFSRWSVEAP